MRKIFLLLSLAFVHAGYSQSLTVDYIMRDPKWMGTSPTNAFWSHDSKTVYFNWNPQKNISDSLYAFAINATAPEKANTNIFERNNALSNAVYNAAGTQMVYGFRGDTSVQYISPRKPYTICVPWRYILDRCKNKQNWSLS